MKKIRKAVFLMAALSLICGLSGCQMASKPIKHQIADVTSVSISCGHMDRSYGYSFWAHKDKSCWLFDAECFTMDHQVETTFTDCVLTDKEAAELLEILEQTESIDDVENKRKSKKSVLSVADTETYSFSLMFSDKKQYVTHGRQNRLEEFFYRLAKKYGEPI